MKVFITITLYIFLIVVIFVLITSKTHIVGIRSYVVLTGSMEPAIPAGSMIAVQKQSTYNTGDIITFTSSSVEVTHRIISTKKSNNIATYQTKGDANQTSDQSLVYRDTISGKVIFYVPYMGKAVVFLKTLPGLVFFIILPGIFLYSLSYRRLKLS